MHAHVAAVAVAGLFGCSVVCLLDPLISATLLHCLDGAFLALKQQPMSIRFTASTKKSFVPILPPNSEQQARHCMADWNLMQSEHLMVGERGGQT